MEIVELTPRTWPSLETSFGANKTVGCCWCTWFMRPHAEEQVGWGAVAPRPAYPRLDRSKITDSGAGPETWSVTCFFVHRRGTRRALVRKEIR